MSTTFVGAVTLLQWACSRIRLLPSLARSATVEAFPFHEMAHFPMRVELGREEGAAATQKNADTAAVSMAMAQEAERHNFGCVLTHCHTAYWDCLAFYLECVYDCNEVPAPLPSGGRDTGSSVEVGSGDVGGLVDGWLDNLDVAAGDGVGVIIESLSTLLPKVQTLAAVLMGLL